MQLRNVTGCVLVQLGILAACVWIRNVTFTNRLETQRPHVQLSCGPLYGSSSQNVTAFRGLRYGVAPLKQRRWRPAEAAPCVSGKALEDGNSCLQGGGAGESEDCLNLNVFVPSEHLNSGTLLPVVVWIYGGANVAGSVEFYGPIENIVRKHACILVAMNYRVGIFGFLALRELAAVDPRGTSGNVAITDQQLALHWVQKNIRSFGGDPLHVTLMGQSSGGTNILAHLASEHSRGLFHRAISLSGSPNITMDRHTKEAQDRNLILPKTPCVGMFGDALLECLYNTDAHILDKALPDSYQLFDTLYDYPTNRQGISSRVSTLLHVDGVTVTFPIEEALQRGINDVPLLLQSMQAEMDCAPAKKLENLTQQGFKEFLHQQFEAVYGEDAVEKIYDMYKHYQPPELSVYAVDSDSGSACGLRRLAQAAGQGFKSPVYWSTVTASPSHALKGQRFAYHNWDFTAASDTFARYDKEYQPSQEDLKLGSRFLNDWFDLILHGQMFDGWRKVQDSERGEVVGSVVGEERTQWYKDHKAGLCDYWKAIGVDQRWWWIN